MSMALKSNASNHQRCGEAVSDEVAASTAGVSMTGFARAIENVSEPKSDVPAFNRSREQSVESAASAPMNQLLCDRRMLQNREQADARRDCRQGNPGGHPTWSLALNIPSPLGVL